MLAQINEKIAPNHDEVLMGEPRRIDPAVQFQKAVRGADNETHEDQLKLTYGAGPVAASPYFAEGFVKAQSEIESWVRWSRSEARKPKFVININLGTLKSKFNVIGDGFKEAVRLVGIIQSKLFNRRNFLAVAVV